MYEDAELMISPLRDFFHYLLARFGLPYKRSWMRYCDHIGPEWAFPVPTARIRNDAAAWFVRYGAGQKGAERPCTDDELVDAL